MQLLRSTSSTDPVDVAIVAAVCGDILLETSQPQPAHTVPFEGQPIQPSPAVDSNSSTGNPFQSLISSLLGTTEADNQADAAHLEAVPQPDPRHPADSLAELTAQQADSGAQLSARALHLCRTWCAGGCPPLDTEHVPPPGHELEGIIVAEDSGTMRSFHEANFSSVAAMLLILHQSCAVQPVRADTSNAVHHSCAAVGGALGRMYSVLSESGQLEPPTLLCQGAIATPASQGSAPPSMRVVDDMLAIVGALWPTESEPCRLGLHRVLFSSLSESMQGLPDLQTTESGGSSNGRSMQQPEISAIRQSDAVPDSVSALAALSATASAVDSPLSILQIDGSLCRKSAAAALDSLDIRAVLMALQIMTSMPSGSAQSSREDLSGDSRLCARTSHSAN